MRIITYYSINPYKFDWWVPKMISYFLFPSSKTSTQDEIRM